MINSENAELISKVVEELKQDYIMVHKDQWRVYLSRTIGSILLVGGVTFLAVLAVVKSSSTWITTQEVQQLIEGARRNATKLQEIKDSWENQEVSVSSLTIASEGQRYIQLKAIAGKPFIQMYGPTSKAKEFEVSLSSNDYARLLVFDKNGVPKPIIKDDSLQK